MKRGYLYIAVTTLLFSSMEVALKLISGQFNPIQLNFSRFVVGGLVLIPFAVRELKKRGRKLDGKALGSFALLGLMGIAVSMSLYQLSVTRIQASVVGVLFSSNPVFVTLFAFLLLHETISKNQVAGLVLDVAGIVLIIQPWNLKLDTLGVVYVLLATLLFALYGVCGKRQCARFGGLVVTCFGFLFGAAEMIALAGLTHIPSLAASLTAAGLDTFASIPFFTGYTLESADRALHLHRRDRYRLHVLLPVHGGHERADDVARVLLQARARAAAGISGAARGHPEQYARRDRVHPLRQSGVHPPRPARAAKKRAPGHGRRDQRKNRSLNPQSLRPQRSLRALFTSSSQNPA